MVHYQKRNNIFYPFSFEVVSPKILWPESIGVQIRQKHTWSQAPLIQLWFKNLSEFEYKPRITYRILVNFSILICFAWCNTILEHLSWESSNTLISFVYLNISHLVNYLYPICLLPYLGENFLFFSPKIGWFFFQKLT